MDDEHLTKEEYPPTRNRKSHSVFAPILLITAGVFFLLENLNMLPALNWTLALRFWPLLLIFIGLNVLVVQIRRPWGTLFSLIVALVAVGVFGYLLLQPNLNSLTERIGFVAPAPVLNEETFAVSSEGVGTAEIRVELGNEPTTIRPLVDEALLISGTVQTYGDLEVQTDQETPGLLKVQVQENTSGNMIFDPASWGAEGGGWELFLNPGIPINLQVDGQNGSIVGDLKNHVLSYLRLTGGNGAVDIALPGGNYDMNVNGGNGRLSIELPSSGRQELEIDGGNGNITLSLPADMEARVEFEEGSGDVSVSERFSLVAGENDAGAYETSGYETATSRILIILKSGNGRVNIQEP